MNVAGLLARHGWATCSPVAHRLKSGVARSSRLQDLAMGITKKEQPDTTIALEQAWLPKMWTGPEKGLPKASKWTRLWCGHNSKVLGQKPIFLSLHYGSMVGFKFLPTERYEDPNMWVYRHCGGEFNRVLIREVGGHLILRATVDKPHVKFASACSGAEVDGMLLVENRPPYWREVLAELKSRMVKAGRVTEQQAVRVVLGEEELKPVNGNQRVWAAPAKARAKRAVKATAKAKAGPKRKGKHVKTKVSKAALKAVKLVRGMGKSEASASSKPAPPSPGSESSQVMSPMRKPVKKMIGKQVNPKSLSLKELEQPSVDTIGKGPKVNPKSISLHDEAHQGYLNE